MEDVAHVSERLLLSHETASLISVLQVDFVLLDLGVLGHLLDGVPIFGPAGKLVALVQQLAPLPQSL